MSFVKLLGSALLATTLLSGAVGEIPMPDLKEATAVFMKSTAVADALKRKYGGFALSQCEVRHSGKGLQKGDWNQSYSAEAAGLSKVFPPDEAYTFFNVLTPKLGDGSRFDVCFKVMFRRSTVDAARWTITYVDRWNEKEGAWIDEVGAEAIGVKETTPAVKVEAFLRHVEKLQAKAPNDEEAATQLGWLKSYVSMSNARHGRIDGDNKVWDDVVDATRKKWYLELDALQVDEVDLGDGENVIRTIRKGKLVLQLDVELVGGRWEGVKCFVNRFDDEEPPFFKDSDDAPFYPRLAGTVLNTGIREICRGGYWYDHPRRSKAGATIFLSKRLVPTLAKLGSDEKANAAVLSSVTSPSFLSKLAANWTAEAFRKHGSGVTLEVSEDSPKAQIYSGDPKGGFLLDVFLTVRTAKKEQRGFKGMARIEFVDQNWAFTKFE